MPAERETTARVNRAAALLRAHGWTVMPPAPKPQRVEPDQCEYPDRHGEPGDCCTGYGTKRRYTRHGWMWLCGQHITAPEAELFDERLVCHAG